MLSVTKIRKADYCFGYTLVKLIVGRFGLRRYIPGKEITCKHLSTRK